MPNGRCSIAPIDDLKTSARRAIVFLVCNGVLNGKTIFDGLSEARDREVRGRFDHWIDGNVFPRYFHGWNDSPYNHCFCFRWKDNRVHQRLYGFICNPKREDQRFELCVLVLHAAKTTEDTDFAILAEINRLRLDAGVITVIRRYVEGK
jgi:hypothetical protein